MNTKYNPGKLKTNPKILKLFALIELFTAAVLIALAVIFYAFRKEMSLGNDLSILYVLLLIGGVSLISAPILFTIAKKQERDNPSPIEY
jgi:hypothetical protein